MMVFAYNKNTGLREYESRDEAEESIRMKQLILREGVTYVKLEDTDIIGIFVHILDENLEVADDSTYMWSMKNKWLQSNVFPYAKRVLRTNSRNNRVWKIRFYGGEIESVEQLISNNHKNMIWHPITDDLHGIYNLISGNFSVNLYNAEEKRSVSVGTVFSIKTALKLKKYYSQKGCPSWMKAWTKDRYFSKKLDELFSDYARKWDVSFDNDVRLLYDSQYDAIPEKESCSLDSVIPVEDVEEVDSEEVTLCCDTDECDLIERVLHDLLLLDNTSFRHLLDFGNLKTELNRIYGEKVIQKKFGGAI